MISFYINLHKKNVLLVITVCLKSIFNLASPHFLSQTSSIGGAAWGHTTTDCLNRAPHRPTPYTWAHLCCWRAHSRTQKNGEDRHWQWRYKGRIRGGENFSSSADARLAFCSFHSVIKSICTYKQNKHSTIHMLRTCCSTCKRSIADTIWDWDFILNQCIEKVYTFKGIQWVQINFRSIHLNISVLLFTVRENKL